MYILKRAIQKEMEVSQVETINGSFTSPSIPISGGLCLYPEVLAQNGPIHLDGCVFFFLCRIAERPFKEDAEKGNFSLLQWHERQGTSWDMFMRFTILL